MFYSQVVTLVLYTYFIAALLGRQMIPKVDGGADKKYEDPDLYFPLFTALQVCWYLWLTLMNSHFFMKICGFKTIFAV